MFNERVIKKSNKPTAKIVVYSSDPCGASPKLICTIKAVIACIDSSGLKVKFGVEPAATVTIIVSPIALDMPNITDADIPDRAAGTTTLKAV